MNIRTPILALAVAGAMTTGASAQSAASNDSATMDRASPEMKKVLTALADLDPRPIATLTPEVARQQPTPADATMKVIEDDGIDVPEPQVTKEDVMYPAADGMQPARVYTPTDAGGGPFPLIVYIHGGGWVLATIDTYDASAAAMADKADAVVVSLEYRHAPQNKFPAAHEDVLAGYKWAVENSGQWNADADRLGLVGESVGGNMVVATAIAARDQALTEPDVVVSVYPVTQTDMTTASYEENANAKPLNRAMMEWFVTYTIADPSDLQDPRISLVDADLSGLPPTTIINAEIDPLRSDGEMLAEAMRNAGVDAQQRTFAGVTHEFFGMAAVVDAANEAQQMAVDALKAGFANGS